MYASLLYYKVTLHCAQVCTEGMVEVLLIQGNGMALELTWEAQNFHMSPTPPSCFCIYSTEVFACSVPMLCSVIVVFWLHL